MRIASIGLARILDRQRVQHIANARPEIAVLAVERGEAKGLASRTMPRLVFCPTASLVASTAREDALPNAKARPSDRGSGRGGAALEIGDAHARVRRAKRCTLPGFSASSSARHESWKA